MYVKLLIIILLQISYTQLFSIWTGSHTVKKGSPDMAKTSLKTVAYNALRRKIVSCEYAPGMFLNEDMLISALELGRTPIRDALIRLEHEGLVEIRPKKGIFVTPLNLNDINMIFEIRLLYEPYILLNYGKLLPREMLTHYEGIFSNPPVDSFQRFDGLNIFELDNEFHSMIVTACPNIYIKQTYALTQTQNERFRHMTGIRTDNRLDNTFREHLDIVKACLKENWGDAAAKMKYHIEISRQSTFQLAFESAASLPVMP